MNLETLRQYKPQIYEIAKERGISNIRVFGSTVRGEAREDSDVDLLVKLENYVGLEFVDFQIKVEDLLRIKVDVVSENGINKYLKDRILNEAIPL